MIHPHTELKYISSDIGYGVVATSLIPKGTITWVMDQLDRIITPDELSGFDAFHQSLIDKYTFRDNLGNHVLCWDLGRFVNHSFSPNCITTAYNFELAVRDILPGEELTNDYGTLNLKEPFLCMPEEESDREVVKPDDLPEYYQIWDQQLQSAIRYFDQVSQPLQFLLSEDLAALMMEIVAGRCEMESVLSCYCGISYPMNIDKF